MPRIVINEIDLTSASYQLSSTDIVFVPGKSINDDSNTQQLEHQLVLCESISDFEKAYGTTPYCVLPDGEDDELTLNSKTVDAVIKFDDSSLYKSFCNKNHLGLGNTVVCIGSGSNTTSSWQISKYTAKLADLGIEVSDYTSMPYYRLDLTNLIVDGTNYKASVPFTGTKYNTLSSITYYSSNGVEQGTLSYQSDYNFTLDCVNKKIDIIINKANYDNAVQDGYSMVNFEAKTFSIGDTIVITPKYDKSYIYAKELLAMGLPVMYYLLKQDEELEDVADDVYSYTNPEGIMDKGEYSFKYLTSGGYPSFTYVYQEEDGQPKDDPENGWVNGYNNDGSFYKQMLATAATRGDCVALIDPGRDDAGAYPEIYVDENGDALTDENYKLLVAGENTYLETGSIWEAAKQFFGVEDNTEYGAMFIPWANYTTLASYFYTFADGTKTPTNGLNIVTMPPSFAYLKALAKSIRTNANWLAIAGVTRGQVPNIQTLDTYKLLSNTIANEMQPRNGETSINAITNIKPYGLTIWGNRTLKNNLVTAQGGEDGLVATSFLNIRNLVSDVKKTVYNAAKLLMFEQNTQVLWINFLAKITPTLDKMVSGQGLSSYKVIQVPTQEKAKLQAVVRLYPLYALENVEVTVELRDEEVAVS